MSVYGDVQPNYQPSTDNTARTNLIPAQLSTPHIVRRAIAKDELVIRGRGRQRGRACLDCGHCMGITGDVSDVSIESGARSCGVAMARERV